MTRAILALSVITTLSLAGTSALATDVDGQICSDTTWDLAGSPYVVTSSILIGCDATLIIEPCVEVRFKQGLGLTVGHTGFGGGTLVARGTGECPIIFTTNDPYEAEPDPAEAGDWARIYFTDYAVDAEYHESGEYLSGCVLERVVVEYAGDGGGAITAESCSPYLAHCEVRDNAHRGITVDAATAMAVKVEYCELYRNDVTGEGGGIYVTGGADHIVEGNVVHDCTATGGGGGLYVNARATLEANTVSDNSAANSGGGIYLAGGSDGSILSGNEVTGNSTSGSDYHYGGGICLISSTGCTLSGNTVTGNRTTGYGGYGGGIFLNNSGGGSLTGNTVTGNWTTGYQAHGGGIFLINSSSELISNTVSDNTVTDNNAHGAGIYHTSSASSTLDSNTITGNQALGSNSDGGGVYLVSSASCTLTGNTVMDNTAYNEGGGMLFSSSGSCTMTDCAIVGNHTTGGSTGGIYVTNSTWLSFAGDPEAVPWTYNVIKDNDGYCIYNNNAFDPAGSGDIDASYVQWGTDDTQAIQDCIYDYFDNANLGFVLFYPIWEDPELWRWPGAAVSRRTHEVAGPLDIELPLLDPPDPPDPPGAAVETRRDGPMKVVLKFTEPVAAIDGVPNCDDEVSLSVGTCEAVAIEDQEMTIEMSAVPDQTCLAITLSGIADLVGNALIGDHDVHILVLAGDVNGDGNTNLIDMAYVKSKNGLPVVPDNIRFDVNLDGNLLNLIDMALVKSLNGGSASCP